MIEDDKKYQVTAVSFVFDSVSLCIRGFSEDAPEETEFTISFEEYKKLKFSEGDIIDLNLYEELEFLSGVRKAYIRGLKIIANSDHSRRALIKKLTMEGFGGEYSDSAADILCEKGYIDDDKQSKRLAQAYARRKLWGKKRIAAELMAKGYSSASVKAAVSFVPEDTYKDSLSRLIDKKCEIIPNGRELDKLIASLSRMGYGIGEIITEIERRK